MATEAYLKSIGASKDPKAHGGLNAQYNIGGQIYYVPNDRQTQLAESGRLAYLSNPHLAQSYKDRALSSYRPSAGNLTDYNDPYGQQPVSRKPQPRRDDYRLPSPGAAAVPQRPPRRTRDDYRLPSPGAAMPDWRSVLQRRLAEMQTFYQASQVNNPRVVGSESILQRLRKSNG